MTTSLCTAHLVCRLRAVAWLTSVIGHMPRWFVSRYSDNNAASVQQLHVITEPDRCISQLFIRVEMACLLFGAVEWVDRSVLCLRHETYRMSSTPRCLPYITVQFDVAAIIAAANRGLFYIQHLDQAIRCNYVT